MERLNILKENHIAAHDLEAAGSILQAQMMLRPSLQELAKLLEDAK